MRKIAVGYVRCSTESQEESTRQQREAIQKFADGGGFQIIDWFEDFAQTGTDFKNRPAFNRMLQAVEKNLSTFDYILVYDESRWGRGVNPRENSYWKMHFDRHGVSVKVINSQSQNGNDIGSYVVEVVESAEASEYSKKLGRATLRGAIDNARRGFSNGGTPPYGYSRIAVDKISGIKSRDLHPGDHINTETEKSLWALGDPVEIEVVKRIFALKIQGLGDVSIADALNRDRIPPPKRGRWRNKDQKWAGVTISTILKNPTYYGCRIYNRHPQSHLAGPQKEVWINQKEEWVLFENAHTAIVTKETFELANRCRKDYCRKNRHFYESPYLLSGLIRCELCGFNFQGQNYGKMKLRYYVDGGYINKGKSVCSDFKISKEKLESFVIKAIRSKILTTDLPDRLEELLKKRLKDSSSERLTVLGQFERSLSDVKMRINRLLTAVENGVEYDVTIERLKEAQNEKKALEERISDIKNANLSQHDIRTAKEQVQYLMENFENILKTAPVHVQKELLRKFIHSIRVDRQSDVINVYLKKDPVSNNKFSDLMAGGNPHATAPNARNGDVIVVQKSLKRKPPIMKDVA